METLARIYEAAVQFEQDTKKEATLKQVKEQIALVRATLAKLNEVCK